MKIRLAKKIMKHKCTFLDLEEEYKKKGYNVKWLLAWASYDKRKMCRNALPFDHRITKAISLTDHWNARRYINELIKSNKKHPFKLRDVQRDAERLKQCSVLKCCGNCHWFDNEDVYGVGWCSNNEHESSCDQVCDEHEF